MSAAQASVTWAHICVHSYPVGIENFSITLSTLDIPRKVKGLLLVCFFVGVLKHSPKLIWVGGKGFVPAYRFILKGTQGKNSKREPGVSN